MSPIAASNYTQFHDKKVKRHVNSKSLDRLAIELTFWWVNTTVKLLGIYASKTAFYDTWFWVVEFSVAPQDNMAKAACKLNGEMTKLSGSSWEI